MRRLAFIAALALVAAVAVVMSACEDDSLYKAGGSTFQNDKVDGAAGAARAADAGGAAAGGYAGP